MTQPQQLSNQVLVPLQTVCKFQCESIKTDAYGQEITLNAVCCSKGDTLSEDALFTKFTPQGKLSFRLSPGAGAYERFVPGRYYYLTITEANGQ